MYITKGVDPLLCSRLFFISTRSANAALNPPPQAHSSDFFSASRNIFACQHKWIGACVERFLVLVHKKLRANLLGYSTRNSIISGNL